MKSIYALHNACETNTNSETILVCGVVFVLVKHNGDMICVCVFVCLCCLTRVRRVLSVKCIHHSLVFNVYVISVHWERSAGAEFSFVFHRHCNGTGAAVVVVVVTVIVHNSSVRFFRPFACCGFD